MPGGAGVVPLEGMGCPGVGHCGSAPLGGSSDLTAQSDGGEGHVGQSCRWVAWWLELVDTLLIVHLPHWTGVKNPAGGLLMK